MKHHIDERSHKDPVCGMVVSRLTAVAEAEFQSKQLLLPGGIFVSRVGLARAETLHRTANADSLPSANQVKRLKLNCPPSLN
jgi:hypothetical protein